MRTPIFFTGALLLGMVQATAAQTDNIRTAENPIKDQYIVVFNEEALAANRQDGLRAAERRAQVRDLAETKAGANRARLGPVFADSITGFTARMNRSDARALARDPQVAYVAEDGWVEGTASEIQLDPPSWGLDRTDQRVSDLDSTYSHLSYAGDTPVHVYVLDTGIRHTHQDFGGRVDVENSFNPYTDGEGIDDCHGHGTHIAGTIGGEQHGMAKNVILHPVRVLNCYNGGPVSAIIMGVEWITGRMIDEPHPAVANMSLVTSASDALDDAVRASIAAGVTYVVAAGDHGTDACNYSPARVAETITVGAVLQNDEITGSSNYGNCVDLYAPGAGIRSTFNRSDEDTLLMSGTSVAVPHVTGIAANVLIQSPGTTPEDMALLIKEHATRTEAINAPGDNNRLAFSLIEVENPVDAPANIQLSFTAECHDKSRRCVFEAMVEGTDKEVTRYFWDFGDGSTHDHHRPIARNGYRDTSGTVTVILAVLMESGEEFMTEQEISLPF